MKRIERWGDPQDNREYTDDELYIESQIVYNGKLTSYGEELYESMTEYYYDEKQGKWIALLGSD